MNEEIDLDQVADQDLLLEPYVAKPYQVQACRMDAPFKLTINGEEVKGRTGDYVIVMASGARNTLTEEKFEKAFMKLLVQERP